MPDHATLYCTATGSLEAADLEAALPHLDLAERTQPGPRVELLRAPDGTPTTARARLGAVSLAVHPMPEDQRLRHLAGLSGFLAQRCELLDPTVTDRVREVRLVLGLVFEPGLAAAAGPCARFIQALAERTGALVFRPDGTLSDARGQVLARPGAPASAEARTGDTRDDDEAVDEGPEAVPPTAERVAQRALVVMALSMRAHLEEVRPPDASERLAGASRWLMAHGLLGELDEEEARLWRAPLGSWSQREVINHGWAGEGAGVLAWALGLCELPAHDVGFDARELLPALGLLEDAPAALASPQLRPEGERAWMHRRLLGLHWRLRDFSLNARSMDYAAFARENWFGGFDLTGIALAEGDLAVTGEPLSRAPADAVRRTHSIAMERHRAANWLAGDHPVWSEVDTST